MKVDNETIICFKNGRILHLPYKVYDEITFDGTGVTELQLSDDKGIRFEVQFKQEDVLYITRTTQNTFESKN